MFDIVLIFYSFISLILLILPGCVFSHFIWNKNKTKIEKIYFGCVISFIISILTGFILSFFNIFNVTSIIVCIFILNSLAIILLFYKRKVLKNTNLLSNFKKSIPILLLFVFFVLIIFLYLQYENVNSSSFSPGWDRGNHFSKTVYLIDKGHLWPHHLGSPYKEFYPQGLYVLGGMLALISSFIARLNLHSISYLELSKLSIFFNLFFASIIAMYPLAIYSVSKVFLKSRKISLLALIMFLPFSAYFILNGTIGTNLTVFLSAFPIILSIDFLSQKKQNILKYSLFSLSLVSIFLIHPQITIYSFVTPALLFLIAFIKKDITLKKASKLILIIILSAVLSVSFLILFNNDLLHGKIDEISRKFTPSTLSLENSGNMNSVFIESSSKGIYSIIFVGVLFIFLFILGLINSLANKRIYLISLFGIALLLCFFPLFPLSRPLNYLLYPVIMIYALGAYNLLELLKSKKRMVVLIVTIILSLGITKTTIAVFKPSHWIIDESIYSNAYKLSDWISKNLDHSMIIACPAGGPPERLLEALTDNKYYFSDPRYPDIPSYQEISIIYNQENNIDEKVKMLEKYKINAIISAPNSQKIDIKELSVFYPNLKVDNVNSTTAIILLKPSSE